MGNSLEELLNTKQFSKFTKKDYQEWKAKRDLVNLPLLPNEPVLYFDLEEKTEIKVQW